MLGQGIEQLYVFAVFVVLGVALAALYLFGIGLFRKGIAAIIFDCIWGATSLYLVWQTNLAVNNGQCRLFLFVALALGAALAYITCKSLLDKASALLYNLFTTKLVDESDGANLLQKVNVDTVRDGDISVADTRMHSAGVSDPAVGSARTRRRNASKNSRLQRSKNHNRRTARLHAIQRLREKMGRGER